MKLVTFLGTGNYQSSVYQLGDHTVSSPTRYIQAAIGEIRKLSGTPIEQIIVIGTDDSKEKHFDDLNTELLQRGLPKATFTIIPKGKSSDDFWEIFNALRLSITGDHVALDITHGFRSQPFFASAVLNYLASVEQLPEIIEIYYGEYLQDEVCPIWDLSPFLDLLQWSSAIEAFVKYGKWTTTGNMAAKLENSIRRKLYQEQASKAKTADQKLNTTLNIKPFLIAMNELGEALDTLRIPHIMTNARYLHEKNKSNGHAQNLLEKLALCKNAIKKHMPPLEPLLDQLEQVVKPMATDSLKGEKALLAQQAIARQLYLWDRATDASVVIREAGVSKYLSKDILDDNDIDVAHKQWETQDKYAQTTSNVRNDLMHGGWRSNAIKGNSLKTQIKTLINDFDTTIGVSTEVAQLNKTLIVSRHPGAIEWLAQQGYKNATLVSHLDIEQVERGDTVVGTLPVHQAAQIAEKRATFIFLEINIPQDKRGQELTLDEMNDFGARLQEYSVRAVNRDA